MAADRYSQFAYSFLDDAVSRHGSKTALEDELGHTITYLELSRRVNQFAHLLRARGIGPEDVVALYLERSINVFVAVYGILKAGAAFCAVDPANPPERTAFILDELDCRLAVTDKTHRGFFDGRGVESVDIDTLDLSMFSDQQLTEIGLQPHNLAYILYTSGSTGRPKGAMISHSSIAASIAGMTRVCGTTSEWRSLWVLNYVFDGSYYDVFAVLGAGGTVCVASKASLVADMGGCVNRFQCTHLFVTPSISKVLDPIAMPQLQVLVVGGEAPHPGLRDLWAKRVKLINAYGPTECAILVLTKVITPETKQLTALSETTTFAKVTIRALDSTDILPDGEMGELCIEGAQVGRGYLKRPEQTSTAFVSAESGRIYRTGDLGRRLPDGQLELLGRKDDQVKINGYRIEMEEVENAVLLTGLVKACVVVAAMVQGKKQLVACCLFDETHQADHNVADDPILPPTRTTQFDAIQSKLDTVPAWMMPTLWIPLSFVPLAPTGKTERKRLITSIEGMDDIKVQEYQACLARRAVMQA